MWTVVYIAVGKGKAEFFKRILSAEGILANLRPAGNGVGGNASNMTYELIVPASEAEEAHSILMQNLTR